MGMDPAVMPTPIFSVKIIVRGLEILSILSISTVFGTVAQYTKSLYADPAYTDPCLPRHVHLSFGSSIFDVTVLWATAKNCTGKVQYGEHPFGMTEIVSAKTIFFGEQNRDGLQYLHKAEMKQLLPETTYFYMPDGGGSQSGPFYFKTSCVDSDWSPDFLFFGDLGIYSNSTPSLVNEALSGKYTALFHVGDFAYDLKNQGGLVGDYFFDIIQPAAASVPYMTCPGNHEIDDETFTHYRHRFAMPTVSWPTPVNKLWYSIDVGPVHFVSYSTEVFFTNHKMFVDDQYKWLVQDLSKANKNRNRVPWIIAFGHRPMYCSSFNSDDCSKPESLVRAGLEELFVEQSVDIVIQGHEHNYERMWPVYQGKVVARSYVDSPVPIQLISGAAGSQERTDSFSFERKPDWSAFRLDVPAFNSYGRLFVENHTHVFWEQRSVENHTTLDSIWIIKNRNETAQVQLSTEIRNESDECCQVEIKGLQAIFKNNKVLVLAICGASVLIVAGGGSLILRFMLRARRKRQFSKVWSGNREESDSEDDIYQQDQQNLL